MFGKHLNPAAAYTRVSHETGVSSGDPHQLITMLYDGAILSISSARAAMQNKDVAAKGRAISRAIDIICNGLRVSLDIEAGGELAERLASLYDYMERRLLEANLRNDPAVLDEISTLLKDLRDAWKSIEGQTPAQAAG